MGISEIDWNPEGMFKVEAGLTHYLDQLQTFMLDGQSDSFETESGEPFCGCDVCFTREVMAYLVPRIARLVKEGDIWWPTDN